MARRRTRNITNIRGTGVVDASQVWRVFECARPGCDCLMKASEDWLESQRAGNQVVAAKCPKCGFENTEDILDRASRWKYCRVCEWLQPLENFHKHAPTSHGFRSGRQLECRVCKNTMINPVLNPKRTSDQHREASQRRRLYSVLASEAGKIDSRAVFDRFEGKCFHCGKQLIYKVRGAKDFNLDHTLPAKYFWSVETKTATLLCGECNNVKHDKWPSEAYSPAQLKRLCRLTGIAFELLAGRPRLNEAAVKAILANVDKFIEQWVRYPEEIKKVRQLILQMDQIDIYERATVVPDFLK